MSPETVSLLALGLTVITTIGVLIEKAFGGGNRLSNRFATHEKETLLAITKLQDAFYARCDTNNENHRVGFEAMSANIHALQIGFLEFRAKMAEEYMKSDSYYKASEGIKQDFKSKNDELKSDMKEGFARLEKTLSDITQSIEAGRKATTQRKEH